MKKLCLLSAILCTSVSTTNHAFAASAAQGGADLAFHTETLLAAARLGVPYGQSSWEISFSSPVFIGPLKLYWVQSSTCGGFRANVDVLDPATGRWTQTRFESGSFIPQVSATSRVRLLIDQRTLAQALCDVQVRSVSGDQTSPSPGTGTRTLAGVIDYAGGFEANGRITLTQPVTAERLEVFVPAYCEGLELIEGSVAQGAKRTKAALISTRPLTLTLPTPTPFDTIELSLIGPQGRACQLPVYTYNLTPPTPTPASSVSLEFEHETFDIEALDIGQ
jgi:hypothetical protein